MTHRLHENTHRLMAWDAPDDSARPKYLSEGDLRNLARVISACTLGLWAFAAGLLIGTFLFS